MKHLMNTKTEKLTRQALAFLLALVLTTSAFVPGLTARATEGETPTLESLKPLKDYETAVALLADLDTIAQALPEDAAKEDIKAVYDTVVAAQTDAEALTGDVALTEEKKAEVAAQAATILTYLTEQRGYVPAEPEAQNDEDEEDETPTCTCPEGTEGHIEGCPLYVAPCGTCGETGTHKADCATLCTCEDKTQPHVEGCPLYVAPCELCGETGTHKADCATLCTCPEGTEGHVAECPLYICADCGQNKCICSLESAYLLDGAVVYKDYNNTEDTKTIAGWNTAVKIQSSVTAEDGTVWYQFVYSNVLKELLNGYHFVRAEDTTTLKCTCTPEDGEHAEDCALYVAPSAYELAMKELAALEEEAKTLADGLDAEAEDYTEKLTEICNEFYDRLFEVINRVADLWDADEITDEEYSAAEAKVMDTLQYLLDTYHYANGEISTLDVTMSNKVLPTITREESGITFELFNYSGSINYKDSACSEARDYAKYFSFHSPSGPDATAANGKPAYPVDSNEVAHLGTNHLLYMMNLYNGYPVIDKASNGDSVNVSVDYLFGGKSDHAVKSYKNIINTPLIRDENGYYSYESAKNAADLYDRGDGTYEIRVRDYAERGKSAADANVSYVEGDKIADFFPFNSVAGQTIPVEQAGGVDYHYVTGQIDYWFGARMHATFYIPKDSKVGNAPMKYEFSGDDDVMVYIDGVFVMDLGGAHARCSGTIDFETGLVETWYDAGVDDHKQTNGAKWYIETIYDRYKKAYKELEPTLTDAQIEAKLADVFVRVLNEDDTPATVTDAKGQPHAHYRFKDFTEHTFDWFYMERWAGQANFNTKFNLPTLPEYGLSVSKDVVGDDNKASEFDFYLNVRNHNGEVDDLCRNLSYTKSNGTSGTLTSSTGNHTFQLKDDEMITVSIPHGYTYTVSEQRRSTYKTSVNGSETGTITKLERVSYTNILQTGKVNVDKTVESDPDDLKSFTIKMEANATATMTNIVKPADVVLVLDQSASMYTPMGLESYLENDRFHDELITNEKVVSYTAQQVMEYFNSPAKDAAGLTFADKVQQLGYIVAQSRTGGNVLTPGTQTFDWFIVKYVPGADKPWHLYRVDSSTDPINDSSTTENKLLVTYETLPTDDHFMFYKSQYGALYDSITAFVEQLHASGVDHRLAVVGYSGDSYSKHKDNGSGVFINGNFKEYFNADGTNLLSVTDYQNALVPVSDYSTIKENIKAVKTDFYNTHQEIGLELAKNVLSNATAVSTDLAEVGRERIVLLFTDGQPNGHGLKKDAVEKAYEIKTAVKNPAEIYTICTATAGSGSDAGSQYSDNYDGTKFLDYISSDYPSATTIDSPGTKTSSGHSMNVTDAADLVSKFLEVVTNVGGDKVVLDENAVLRDTLSGEFTIPAYIIEKWDNAVDDAKKQAVLKEYITVSTAAYLGNSQWDRPEDFDDAIITLTKNGDQYVIGVSNFDYSEHYVTENARENGYRGSKLMVEFPITASESNKGGNEQATNDYDDSGLYNGEVVVERLPLPHVDTPTDVKLTKLVSGNLGDHSQEFTFAASYDLMTDHNDNGTYTSSRDIYSNYSEAVVRGLVPESITLKHDEYTTLENLYVGGKIHVAETNVDGYTVKIKINGEEITETNVDVTITPGMEIVFTNTKEVTIDTGISLDSIPYIVILVGVAAVVGFLFLRKRRIED